MITIDEMKHEHIYKKQFYAPFNLKDKKHGSLIFLLTKGVNSSIDLIRNKFMINKKYFESYYVEKDITYYINHEGFLIDSEDMPYNVISESARQELANPYNYVSALELNNFDCTNINESFDDIYDLGTPKIIKGFPDFLSKVERDNLKDMIISKGDKYFAKVSKNWSIKDLHRKNPFRCKQDLTYPNIQKTYFDTMSSKCIIPRDYSNRDDRFYLVYPEKDDKTYTALLLCSKERVTHIWLVFNDDLVSLDLFLNECLLENNLPQEIETEEKVQIETSNLIKLPYTTEGYQMNKYYYRDNGAIIIFNEALESIEEATKSDTMLKKLLYRERLKNNKEIFEMYDNIRIECPEMIHRYLDLKKYNSLNLFVDLQYYNNAFFKSNIYKNNKALDIYYQFLTNMLCNDLRFSEAGYTKKNVFINLDEWRKDKVDILNYKEDINPLSVIIQKAKTELSSFQAEWDGLNFVILSNNCYMKISISKLDGNSYVSLRNKLNKLLNRSYVPEDPTDETKDSKESIIASITDKLEKNKNIKIHNLTGDSGDITKDELVQKIEKAASVSNTEDDAIDQLETDEKLKEIINQLEIESDETNKISNSRKARISQLQKNFLEKKLEGKTVRQLIEENDVPVELPETKLELDTIDEGWEHLQYTNFDKIYDPRQDILDIIYSFSNKVCPVAVQDFTIENTSTTEDLIETWTVKFEDSQGNRFTLKFDVPKLKDDKFMILRGNEKTINGQNVLLPISKTDADTVQIVSNYNKIFIRTYGAAISGRSCMPADLLMKALNKYEGKNITFTSSDNSEISKKYELPIDYIDIGNAIGMIETPKYIFYFNQDEIREKYDINEKVGIPIGYDKKIKQVLYYKNNHVDYLSTIITNYLTSEDTKFNEIYQSCKPSTKYYYSKASILNTTIPLIVIMGYSEGLITSMKKAGVKYDIVEKKPTRNVYYDFIKFKDGYIQYENTLANSLLMNGLKECNTEDYMISEINTKAMYLDFLNLFGGMILSDGLDNFYDLEIDPITEEVLRDMKLTTDYVELLAYANELLSDNKYVAHTDLSSKRYRSNELIAAYTYKALADSYAKYRNQLKRSSNSTMTIKRSQVIDNIMLDPTAADASILNPLLEIETMNSVTPKGLSGMNSDRSYTLDKRTYGDSMVNVLALSTGFAGNVGITRQATIDMNIQGKRGYIKQTKDKNDLSTTKSFCMTEALIPYGATHDDPFRMAMGFIQNSKHAMKTSISSPQIISNGADQALPYMITNNFAFKSKESGKVIEKTDNYMIVKYKSGASDFIDLRDNVKKNSNAGFYTTVKLDTNFKVGQTFKDNEILAYDKSFFSNQIGGNLAYNAGVLTKVAIINTDEGFEDSAIVTEWLSHALSSPVTVLKEVNLAKNTNVLKMLKKGDSVQEGDDIMIFQNSYDEEDVNMLLKSLSDDLDEITDLGKIPLKSKITGVIKDIKVYRTCEKDELSPSLKKIVNSIEKESADISSIAKKNGVDYVNGLNPTYKLEQSGKVKNLEDSVKIEFYLQYEDTFSIGDKLVYYTAVKGVDKDIIKTGLEPYTNREPDEPIDSFVPLGGISARMVTSIENVVSCNKVFIELDKCIKKKVGIKNKTIREKVSNKK